MFHDETPQKMFNQLKKMVNKVNALGSKRWTDHMLTKHLMRAYTTMNYNVVSLIREDPTYKMMTSVDVLGRIINHEMYTEEVNHFKNLYKGVTTTKKQEIAFKASKKSKNKQVVFEGSSEEEEEEDSSDCGVEEMALFMIKFKKYNNNKKISKGDKKSTTRPQTKRMCYSYGKYGHFIANYPFERRDDDDDKKKSKFSKKDKSYKKDDKYYKKKSYGEAHTGQECDSNDESSNSDSDGVATMAIKGISSSKSLLLKLNQEKHTCLMAKESKCKLKTKSSSSPKYVSSDDDEASDDDAPLPIGKNEKATIKRLGKELVVWDQLLKVQEDLLEQERQTTCELKRLLKFEMEKNKNLAKELA
jgi:hypothetical protein